MPEHLAGFLEGSIGFREIRHGRSAGVVTARPAFRLEEVAGTANADRAGQILVSANDHQDFVHPCVASDSLAGQFETFRIVPADESAVAHVSPETAATPLVAFRCGYGGDKINVEQLPERFVRLDGEILLGTGCHVAQIGAVCNLAVRVGVTHENDVDSIPFGRFLIDRHFAFPGIIGGQIEVRLRQIGVVKGLHDVPILLPLGVFGIKAEGLGRNVDGQFGIRGVFDHTAGRRENTPAINRFQFLGVLERIRADGSQVGRQGHGLECRAE